MYPLSLTTHVDRALTVGRCKTWSPFSRARELLGKKSVADNRKCREHSGERRVGGDDDGVVVVVMVMMIVVVVVMMMMEGEEEEDPSKSFNAGLTTCTGR